MFGNNVTATAKKILSLSPVNAIAIGGGIRYAFVMGMYDKLGDMLNDFLETGRMPPPRASAARSRPEPSGAGAAGESPCPARASPEEPRVPEYLIADFYSLGFVNLSKTPALSHVKKKYRALAKSLHPDTREDSRADGEEKQHLTRLIEAFRRISGWYQTLV